jgi:hypothetical protein
MAVDDVLIRPQASKDDYEPRFAPRIGVERSTRFESSNEIPTVSNVAGPLASAAYRSANRGAAGRDFRFRLRPADVRESLLRLGNFDPAITGMRGPKRWREQPSSPTEQMTRSD